jgi:hypothetical protein
MKKRSSDVIKNFAVQSDYCSKMAKHEDLKNY